MNWVYPKLRGHYVANELDAWYEAALQREDEQRKQAFRAQMQQKLDVARNAMAKEQDSRVRAEQAHTLYALEDKLERHLGIPVDLTCAHLCGTCKRYHGQLT